MGKSVAVTGATGFVGQGVVSRLLAAGHQVSVLVRDPTKATFSKDVRVVRGDVNNAVALQMLLYGADVVIHVAGVVSAVTRQHYFTTNVDGTKAVLAEAEAQGVKRFVNVSSLAAREPGLNAYAASKAAAEQVLNAAQGTIKIIQLRPAAVYGPGDRATLPLLQALLQFIAVVPGHNASRFAMVHVDDVAQVLVDMVDRPETGIFELDDGSGGYGWADVIAVVRRHFERPKAVVYLPRFVALMLAWCGDLVAKLRNTPSLINTGQIMQVYHADWRVKGRAWPLATPILLADGLPQTIRWYQAQGLLPQRTTKDRSATR